MLLNLLFNCIDSYQIIALCKVGTKIEFRLQAPKP